MVYVDNDPVARAHAQILLADTADPDRHFAIDADFFDGLGLWARVVEMGGLDPNQPICLLVTSLLHFVCPTSTPNRC